jgi:histidine ammonia-lyase
MAIHQISAKKLTIEQVEDILKNKKIELSKEAQKKIVACRTYLDNKMKNTKHPIYGINTGFGSLCNTSIPTKDLEKLQENLVKSHACGLGEEVPQEIVKLMLLLKIQGLSYGHSGVQLDTVKRLIDFYNHDILPVVYQQGSLGASGDLAPLAHLSLPLIGIGEVWLKGKKVLSKDMLKQMQWKPIKLQSKEGLALLNGTQFMSAYGVWCLIQASKISDLADKIGALSLDAYDGRLEPMDEIVHLVRGHQGQLKTAKAILTHLKGSEIAKQQKAHVQDPYSFRCMPQVHGASKDAIAYAKKVFETEINAVTDNPTIFPEEDKIISAGNFHGQPLAITLDFLCIALAELASISERRIYKLISGQRGLPAFLVVNPGLNSGFMIPHYAAASVVSQNKQLCTPASVDTIDSSNGQEDHVSMGANAATKCFKIVENTYSVLAVELFNASQAISFRKPLKTSASLETFIKNFRKSVPLVAEDTYMHELMKKAVVFLK